MNTEKIGYIEAIAIITLVIINKVILILPKEIISQTGSAAVLNVVYVSILAFLIVWLISLLYKRFQGYDIIDVSHYLGGNFLKYLIGTLYFILFILVPIFVLRNFAETIKNVYFRSSPFIFILLFFIVSTIIANRFSHRVLAKANLILMILGFLGIALILIASFRRFSYDQLFPLFGYGFKETFVYGLSSLFSFSGIGYLFFFGPILDKPQDFKKISIISIIISGIYLILTVACILLSFSFSFKSGESMSLYLLARTIDFGKFIQRVDAVFIFMWIVSSILYVSFSIYFSIYIFKKLTKISDSSYINYTINLAILAFLLIPVGIGTFNSIVENAFKFLTLVVIFIGSIVILVFANLKSKLSNAKKIS